MMLVSLQQVKDHLNIYIADEDNKITLLIQGASNMIVRYLKEYALTFLESSGQPFLDSNGNAPDVPGDVKTATLLLTGILYENPDGDEAKAFSLGNLPASVTAQIYSLRYPSIA